MRAISAAVVVSVVIGCIARRAIVAPGEQREAGAGERAEHEQQLDARDRVLHVGEGPGVLDHDVAADRRGSGLEDRFDAVAVDVVAAFEARGGSVRGRGRGRGRSARSRVR